MISVYIFLSKKPIQYKFRVNVSHFVPVVSSVSSELHPIFSVAVRFFGFEIFVGFHGSLHSTVVENEECQGLATCIYVVPRVLNGRFASGEAR